MSFLKKFFNYVSIFSISIMNHSTNSSSECLMWPSFSNFKLSYSGLFNIFCPIATVSFRSNLLFESIQLSSTCTFIHSKSAVIHLGGCTFLHQSLNFIFRFGCKMICYKFLVQFILACVFWLLFDLHKYINIFY